jgi:hypothetical protein
MPTPVGSKWYNNGMAEVCTKNGCPEGFVKGRLPLSPEIKAHYKANGERSKNMSVEKRLATNAKISATKQAKTADEKVMYARHVSESLKGKHTGKTPWNKGKKGVQKAWNKGKRMADETRLKQSIQRKGRIPWNKGKHTGERTDEHKLDFLKKQYATKKANGSFNTSLPEGRYYEYLVSVYGADDIVRQYSDSRYPYTCDFYVKSEDLFIELNLSWTHGGKPFDASDHKDIEKLNRWKEKAKRSDFYKNAIETWTVRDVAKRNAFIDNNLNFMVIYSEKEMLDGTD